MKTKKPSPKPSPNHNQSDRALLAQQLETAIFISDQALARENLLRAGLERGKSFVRVDKVKLKHKQVYAVRRVKLGDADHVTHHDPILQQWDRNQGWVPPGRWYESLEYGTGCDYVEVWV